MVLLAVFCLALVLGSLALPSGSRSARAVKAAGFLIFGLALTFTGIQILRAVLSPAAQPVVTGLVTDLFQHSGRSRVYSVFALVTGTPASPSVRLSCNTDSSTQATQRRAGHRPATPPTR